MKVMLRQNCQGHLVVYVAKKDLEEEVIKEEETDNGKIFTLANRVSARKTSRKCAK